MATYLDDIVAYHRKRAAQAGRTLAEARGALARAPAPRAFLGAIEARARRRGVAGDAVRDVAVIAEVKRRSPSKGVLAADLDPAALARAYERGGAACLSVLTDGPHFAGSTADLVTARAAVSVPVLRKDFTVCATDVVDSRAMGADAVLLIAAVLDDDELAEFVTIAGDVGLAALVEVHDEAEAARALGSGASLIGVNQRDLHTFAVDTDRAVRVAAALPDAVIKVAESGVRTAHDVSRLVAAGFDAVLVGEALVTDGDPEAGVARLLRGAQCS